MATDDQQILVTGQAAAPAGFLIPGNGQIKPKAMNAVFDGTNAAGDFTPALEIISDAGIVVARVAAATVTAGDSAEVTWAPFLRGASAAPLGQSRVGTFWNVGGQTVHTGAVTTAHFTMQSGQPSPFGALIFSGSPITVSAVPWFRVYIDYTVNWPAGNYDRYIDISQAGAATPYDLVSQRARESLSPDGDVQHLACVVGGDPTVPQPIQVTLYQASGSDKAATLFLFAYQWTEIAGQGGWPG